MSEERNIETVQRVYAAFGSDDEEAFLRELADDISFELPRLDGLPLDSRYDGKDGMRKFLTDRKPVLEYHAFDIHEFVAKNEHVIVFGETRGRALPTGKPFHHDWVQVFRFKEGKISALKEYVSTEEIGMAFR